MMRPGLPVSGALLRYRVMAYVVGVGLIILVFIGIPLQYAANAPGVVHVVGPIHGALYIVYLITAADLARRARFGLLQLAAMVAAGFVPVLAFVVERQVVHRLARESESAAGEVGMARERPRR
jgi:integral membrane protein